MFVFGSRPEMSSHPVDVGARTEAIIIAELIRRGYRVLLPFGTNQRYDLVVDLDGRFVRVQCKTARLRNGVVRFHAESIRANWSQVFRRRYDGEIEMFLAHCEQTGAIYVMPVEEAQGCEIYLRVSPTANNQSKGVRWARDYELPG